MPRRHEGPALNRQTGFYYADFILGFKPQKNRIRVSLGTKDPAKARFLWEQEYRRRWAEYYGLESRRPPAPVSFADIAREFVAYEKDVRRAKEWSTIETRLSRINKLWENPAIDKIGQPQISALDSWLKKEGRKPGTINHYFKLLRRLFNKIVSITKPRLKKAALSSVRGE